jgi:hypothetical protein
MFDEKTKQKLGYYVYSLKDPLDKLPFYIGKGKNNRIFDHLNCAIENETQSDNLQKIRKVIGRKKNNKIEHIIIRHGLTEKEAYLIEASMIDFLKYFNSELKNIQGGYNSIEKGLMTSEEIIRHYNAKQLKSIKADCIIININKNYKRGMDSNGIYIATKACWTIKKNRLIDKKGNNLIKYVLSEYHGYIVEVFEVEKWYQGERGYGIKAKNYGKIKKGMCFDGRVAPENIRNLYINKTVPKKQGQANVIKYQI